MKRPRAGESDRPTRSGSARKTHLGHFPTGSTAARPSGVVARLLSFCPSARSAASGLCRASRTRWQASGATLSTTDASHGSGQSQPTMDCTRGALTPFAAGFRLRASESRGSCIAMSKGDWYICQQKQSVGASFREEKVCPDCPLTKNQPERGLQRAKGFIHHV